jgi:hypothetical protein
MFVYLDEDLGLGGPGGDVLVYEDDTLELLYSASLPLHLQLPLGQEQGQVPVGRALLEQPRDLKREF